MTVISDNTTGTPPFTFQKLTIDEFLDGIRTYDFGNIKPDKLVLHHTYKPTLDDWRGARTLEGIQSYYAGLGWTGSPHIFAAPDGIWIANPLNDVGTHARSCNATYYDSQLVGYSIGLEMVGDYTTDTPRGAVWAEAVAVMGSLSMRLNISPRQFITFHRYCGKASCPGGGVSDGMAWSAADSWIKEHTPKCLTAYRVTVAAEIHQGPATTFPIAGTLGVGSVLISDGIVDGWAHMARLAPLQYDMGFVDLTYLMRAM